MRPHSDLRDQRENPRDPTMNRHRHHAFPPAHDTATLPGTFRGLAGLTEPLTEQVASALAGAGSVLGGLFRRLREGRERRRTIEALSALDARVLKDIGLEPGDLIDVAKRGLPLAELSRRRVHHRPPEGHFATLRQARRPAANDESIPLAA